MSTHGTAVIEAPAGVFYQAIDLETIAPSKTNPRKHFDEAELQELAQSIRDKGVIQPIVIRPTEKLVNKINWEIVAGERRWRASKIAGLATIPAIARDLDDKAVLEIQVIENLQRSDIHPLEEANGYRELLDKHGYTIERIAEKVGKSQSYIYQRLKLSELIPAAQKLFLNGDINAGHAILIARLSREEQKEVLEPDNGLIWSEDWIDGNATVTSVRVLARRIREELYLDLAKAPWKQNDTKLLPAAGPCTSCPQRSGANPTLFAEISEKNICTDRKCYNQKLDAFMNRSLEDGGLIKVSSEYSNTKPAEGVLSRREYKEVHFKGDRCKRVQKAIVAEGSGRGRTVEVCTDKSCKKHFPPEPASYTSSDPYKKEQQANKLARAKILAIMKAVHQSRVDTSKSSAPVDVMLEETVLKMWDRANMHDQKAVALTLGLEKTTTKAGGYEHSSYDPAFKSYLKEHSSHSDLLELVMLIVASWNYEFCGVDWVRTWAKRGEQLGKGYSVKNVEDRVTESLKPKKKKTAQKARLHASAKSQSNEADLEGEE